MAVAVSSTTVAEAGTMRFGRSFTAVMLMVATAAVELKELSLTMTLIVRAVVEIASDVEEKRICSIAVSKEALVAGPVSVIVPVAEL